MNTPFNIHKIIFMRCKLRQYIESDMKKGASIKIVRADQDVTSDYIGMRINRMIYGK